MRQPVGERGQAPSTKPTVEGTQPAPVPTPEVAAPELLPAPEPAAPAYDPDDPVQLVRAFWAKVPAGTAHEELGRAQIVQVDPPCEKTGKKCATLRLEMFSEAPRFQVLAALDKYNDPTGKLRKRKGETMVHIDGSDSGLSADAIVAVATDEDGGLYISAIQVHAYYDQ